VANAQLPGTPAVPETSTARHGRRRNDEVALRADRICG